MSQKIKVALLSAALLMWGCAASRLAAADEHEHGQNEHGRAEPHPDARGSSPGRMAGPGPGRPGPTFAPARPSFDGRGQVLDGRYNHGRYYPPVGTTSRSLPGEYRPYYRGADRYYFNGGIWYAPQGPGFIVVRPPSGLVISVLPPFYSTVWFGGNPYYYADNVYYTWQPNENGYAVVDPPPDADSPAPPPETVHDDLIIYPKNGQSKEQQSADQFECHNWARGQTGFDPTQAAGAAGQGDADASRNSYNRAMSACLQGRGYQVN